MKKNPWDEPIKATYQKPEREYQEVDLSLEDLIKLISCLDDELIEYGYDSEKRHLRDHLSSHLG